MAATTTLRALLSEMSFAGSFASAPALRPRCADAAAPARLLPGGLASPTLHPMAHRPTFKLCTAPRGTAESATFLAYQCPARSVATSATRGRAAAPPIASPARLAAEVPRNAEVYERVSSWVVFSDLHVDERSLKTCIEVGT